MTISRYVPRGGGGGGGGESRRWGLRLTSALLTYCTSSFVWFRPSEAVTAATGTPAKRAGCGIQHLDALMRSWGAPNRRYALMMWSTVCRLPHGLTIPSRWCLARNEAVFSQPNLWQFTQELRGSHGRRACSLDEHFMNSRKLLLMSAHSLAHQSSIVH